jgi:hypothetical protein
LAVRTAAAKAIGTTLASAYNAHNSTQAKKKGPEGEGSSSSSSEKEWSISDGFDYLNGIFLKASASNANSKTELRAGVTQAAVVYLSLLKTKVLNKNMSIVSKLSIVRIHSN